MDLFAFIYVADPTKVKTIKRERVEEEAKLLDSTIGRVVPLLPVALARAKSKLEASVEKLFDECGSTEQGDFAAGGGHDAEIELITTVKDTAAGNVTVERLKSLAMLTLPFVTSLVSATPEPEGDALLDSVTGGNLRTISSAARFVISSDSSHHSSTNASGAEVDSVIRPDDAGPSHLPWKELSMGSREVDFKNLHDIFVSHWNIPNDTLLDDLDTSREFIDHLAPSVLFAQIRDMDYEELFTEFSVRTARQACLSAESSDEEIENLRDQLLLKEAEAAEAARLRVHVFAIEAVTKGDALLDSVSGGNLCTISSAARFVISSDSSHHSSTNASGAEVDSVIRSDVPPPVTTDAVITTSAANVPPVSVLRVADKVTPQVQQSIFHESTSADTIRPDDAGPSHLPWKELSMGSRE
nr:hypothetical protein [Tanacetum cinerariifolium]